MKRGQGATLALFAGMLLPSSCSESERVTIPKTQVEAHADYATTGSSNDDCPYLPSFVQLRAKVRRLEAAAGLPLLYRYATDPTNENPDTCQSLALDAEIGVREQLLVALHFDDNSSHLAQASYRCGVVALDTSACTGPIEDGTARPFSSGIQPMELHGAKRAKLISLLPDASLRSVYRVRVSDLLDGRKMSSLPTGSPVKLVPGPDLKAIIAIYAAASPGRFRKFVWDYK